MHSQSWYIIFKVFSHTQNPVLLWILQSKSTALWVSVTAVPTYSCSIVLVLLYTADCAQWTDSYSNCIDKCMFILVLPIEMAEFVGLRRLSCKRFDQQGYYLMSSTFSSLHCYLAIQEAFLLRSCSSSKGRNCTYIICSRCLELTALLDAVPMDTEFSASLCFK